MSVFRRRGFQAYREEQERREREREKRKGRIWRFCIERHGWKRNHVTHYPRSDDLSW